MMVTDYGGGGGGGGDGLFLVLFITLHSILHVFSTHTT